MNYIDLHIHTQKLKSGDGNGRVISSTDLVNKLQSNQVKVASITNHNKFDLEEFTDIVKQEPEFTIFPGIELDVDFDNENIKHIVLISDPNIVRDFHHEFSNDKNRNYDNFKLDYSLFIEKVRKFNKKEIIIIPHFLDKDKKRALSIVEKEKLLKDLSEYVVILETGKFKSMGIINAHNEISIFGSDIKQWSNYDQEVKKLPQLKFEIDSFGKFYSLASNPNLFIKTALNGMDKLDVPIESTKIEIFNDINVVFGEKGSGKTIILKNSPKH